MMGIGKIFKDYTRETNSVKGKIQNYMYTLTAVI